MQIGKRPCHGIDVVAGAEDLALDDPAPVDDGYRPEAGHRGRVSIGERLYPAALREDDGDADESERACEPGSKSTRRDAGRENDECREPGERERRALVARRRQDEVALEHDKRQRQHARRAHRPPKPRQEARSADREKCERATEAEEKSYRERQAEVEQVEPELLRPESPRDDWVVAAVLHRILAVARARQAAPDAPEVSDVPRSGDENS